MSHIKLDIPDITVVVEKGNEYLSTVTPSEIYQILVNTGDNYNVVVDDVATITINGSGSYLTVADYASTASYALFAQSIVAGGAAVYDTISASNAYFGNLTVSQSIRANLFTGSFVGNLVGTSSWASNAVSSSFALTASYVSGAASTWDTITNKPTGLVSSSVQINTGSFSGSFTGALIGTASRATSASYVLPAGLPTGTVSSSAQVSYAGLSNIPANIVSSSTQINTGSFTGSFIGTHSGSTFGTASWARNVISSSFATTASAARSITFTPPTASFAISSSFAPTKTGVVSSSVQINTGSFSGSFTGRLIGTASWATSASYVLPSGLPIGTVSSSTQVSYTGLSNIPVNIVSSSTQIVAFGFATTGSNLFNGNQTITGSLIHGLEGNIATGENSHAEGSITKAIGNYSHAEGDNTQAKGDYSHAEGQETIASGSYSHAEGYQTIALANHQHVQGQYNAVSSVPAAFIVGNGTDDSNRSNLIYAAGNEVQITGSLNVTNGITGSLYGTASRALTASFIDGGFY
jgi:hypothetical protein